jgi:hypothetical protein
VATSLLVALSTGAALNHAWGDTIVLATIGAALVLRALSEGVRATSAFVVILEGLQEAVVVVPRARGRSERRGPS